MRTVDTEMAFRREREAVDTMTDRGWTVAQRERARRSMEARHAEYDAKFALMIAQVNAVDLAKKPSVRRRLLALGGQGCRSGSMTFAVTVDALADIGVTGANHVFEHDRAHIAVTYLPAKVREPV